jgi:type IV pilus assembly protein PilN
LRRVNLIPPEDRRRRMEGLPGGMIGLLLVAGAAVLLVFVGVYFIFLLRLNDVESEVAELDGRISEQNNRLAELSPYQDLRARLDEKRPVADGIFRTRFPWDDFFQGLAFVVPETTALQTLTGEAAPVDVEAPAEQPLDPPGAVTFTGLALPEYENVADFVVRMNNLEHVSNAQLNSAELDRETFSEPAIAFEVASELVTVSGERGTEVRIEGGSPAEVAGAEPPESIEVARSGSVLEDQYATEAAP